ncbi:MAG: hypothetical protein ACLFR1_01360 [Spirochaetia bacterium]
MEEIDALELSRRLREETSLRLQKLSWEEKVDLFHKAKEQNKAAIDKKNILLEPKKNSS